jgi:hypothetical protein
LSDLSDLRNKLARVELFRRVKENADFQALVALVEKECKDGWYYSDVDNPATETDFVRQRAGLHALKNKIDREIGNGARIEADLDNAERAAEQAARRTTQKKAVA